jgi:integrase
MKRPSGTGSYFKKPKSRFWWIAYHRNGKLFRQSTHTTDERAARRFLQRRLAEAASEDFIAPQTARVKVEELAVDFLRDYKIAERKSIDDAHARWRLHLQPFFGHLRAVSVSSDLIVRYIMERQEQGAKNATINRELAALKRMFNLGLRATPPKVVRVPTFAKLAERNIRKGFVEDAEYQRLSAAASRVGLWLRALFEVGYAFGWRVSELLYLRISQIDLLNRTITLNPGETKNDDGRVVIMTDAVHQLLTQCAMGKQSVDFVFTRDNRKPVRDFRYAWEAICTEAGAPERLFHDLRRTAVRNMVRAGIPERVAMQISGHKTRAIFDRYHIVSESDLKQAAASMDEHRRKMASVTEDANIQAPAPNSSSRRSRSVH